jgi:hypothetical protein
MKEESFFSFISFPPEQHIPPLIPPSTTRQQGRRRGCRTSRGLFGREQARPWAEELDLDMPGSITMVEK